MEVANFEALKEMVDRTKEGVELVERGLNLIYGNGEVSEGDEAVVAKLEPPKNKFGRDPRNPQPLKDYVAKILKPSKRYTNAQIAQKVLDLGFVTDSIPKNWPNVVRTTIIKSGLYEVDEDGFWSLK